MSKIIITHDNSISDEDSVRFVCDVIAGGKVSNNKNGKHYCWITTWGSGVVVSTRTRKKGQSKDLHSFHVYKD